MTVRVLITGAAGQVGRALLAIRPPGVDVEIAAHADLDIGNESHVRERVLGSRPDVIINAAAYTAVDKAQSEEAAAVRANVEGPRNLAAAAALCAGTRMLHISTDFVFDGRASTPYEPAHDTAPLGVYGSTKLAGEQAVMRVLGNRAVIVRTAWVYAAHGKNFLLTMLRLMKERREVRVVDDQVGTPTAAGSLARALWVFAMRTELCGVFHWTDAGVASWYDFATAIAEEAVPLGLLGEGVTVLPIPSRDYATAAQRPAFSVLDKRSTVAALGIAPRHWRCELRAVMRELTVA